MRRSGLKSCFRIVALAGTFALASISPRAALAENLADALAGAYITSGLLDQQQALLRAADEDVAIAVAQLRPILIWSTRVTRTLANTGAFGFITDQESSKVNWGVTLEQQLFDGGADRLGIEAAKELVLATRQQLLSVEQQVLLRGVNAYLNVQLQAENVRLRQNNLRVLREEQRATQDRFDVGEVTRTDVALAESRVAEAVSGLAAARGGLEQAKAEYVAVVGRRPGTLAPLPSLPTPPATENAAQAVANRNHPDILAAQHQVSATEITVRQTRLSLGPSGKLELQLGGEGNYGSWRFSESASLSATVQQRFYAGGSLAAGLRKTMASRDAARGSLLTAQKNVRQQVSNALVQLQVAGASLKATEEQIRAAQVAFNGIREEATLGSRTTLDVLAAEQQLLNALTARISARADQAQAAYQVLAAQGLLTAERLRLGVPIYDPTDYYNKVKRAPALVSKQGRDLDRVLNALSKN